MAPVSTVTVTSLLLLKLLVVLTCSHTAEGQSYGEVRLRGTNHAGRVEVFINGRWGSICDDGFGYNEADVICRQLGYVEAVVYGKAVLYGFTPDYSQPIWLDEVNCTQLELHLLRCDHRSIGRHDCTHTEDIAVECTHTSNRTVLYDGKVRLRDGDYASMGRVEVYCNNRWGTVCGGVGQDEADTVCRQLGYTGAEQFGFSLKRNSSSGLPVWLRDVRCHAGSEKCLSHCQSCPSNKQPAVCENTGSLATVACAFNITLSVSDDEVYIGHCRNVNARAISGVVVGVAMGAVFLCFLLLITLILIVVAVLCWYKISKSKVIPNRPTTIFLTQASKTSTISTTCSPLSPGAPPLPPRPLDTLYIFNESLSPHANSSHRSLRSPQPTGSSPLDVSVDPEPYAVVFKYPPKSEQKSLN